MLAVLPPEIWDMVIGHCVYDYETLAACARVCRNWHPRAKSMLIRGSHFYNRDDVLRVANSAGAYRSKGNRAVYLRGSKEWRQSGPVPHLAAFAAMFAGRWTRVESLSIWRADWRVGDIQPDTFLHLSAFTSVTGLHLYHVTLPTIATFRHLVCALGNLSRLDCSDLHFSTAHSNPLAFRCSAPRVRLHTLHLSDCPVVEITSFIIAARIGDHIQNIKLWDCLQPFVADDAASKGLGNLLHAMTSFRALSFKVNLSREPGHPMGSQRGLEIFIGNSSTLETLHIHMSLDENSPDYRWLVKTLSQVTSDVIQEINLAFHLTKKCEIGSIFLDEVIASLGWDICMHLEQVLAHSVFSKLEAVTFQLYTDKGEVIRAAWSEAITSRFPKLYERRILRARIC